LMLAEGENIQGQLKTLDVFSWDEIKG